MEQNREPASPVQQQVVCGASGKKGKRTTFIILGTLVIFALGITWIIQQGEVPEVPITPAPEASGPKVEPQPKPEEPTVQTAQEANELVRKAIDNQDDSYCKKIQSEETRDWCKEQVIIAEAMVKFDSTICEELLNEEVKAVCKDSVIVNKAVTDKNPNLCNTLMDKERVEQCKKDASPF